MKPYISVILTSRGRFEQLKSSLDSLYLNCSDKNNYEVIVIFDEDDQETIKNFLSMEKKYNFKILITKRYGYDYLHIQQNMAAYIAEGEWFWIWNDDVEVKSQNWDQIIKEHDGEFSVLSTYGMAAPDWENAHPPFPIIPKKWFQILERITPWNHLDTYVVKLCEVFGLLKFEEKIQYLHDRKVDETNHNVQYHRVPFPDDEFGIDINKIRNYLK